MGISANYDIRNPLDQMRKVSGDSKRPAAVLITYDLATNDDGDSPYKGDLIRYLEKTLDGVKVSQSSYAIPYRTAVDDVIAMIGQITHDNVTVYAFPFASWDGYGSVDANKWFEKHNLPNIT